ncbi:hypothetical protein DE146DRAFT_328372 [Phaeosphaeria sp. MPI-PUGE-AT-0046c]|nr:hypothetical protein DE146DRAFT_328372 [Phaeosphaeria sp. MPI-PUGE-AT-0046c]
MLRTTDLLDLADELLLEAGSYLGQDDLLSISLACRRLRRVGQEQLIRSSIVCPSHIWKLADTLRGRPDLAKFFSRLQIGSLDQNGHMAIGDAISQHNKANTDISCYIDIISGRFPLFTTVARRNRIVDTRDFIRLGVMVLLALSPKIRAIQISMTALDAVGDLLGLCCDSAMFSRATPEEDWARQIRIYFEAGLERLVVMRDKRVADPIPWTSREPPLLLLGGHHGTGRSRDETLNTSRCRQLGALQSSCAILPKSIQALASAMFLPRSLKTLCMNVPANNSVGWRAQVDSLIANADDLPCLHLVELRFQYNRLSTAWNLCSKHEQGHKDLIRFKNWRSSPFRLITSFGDIKKFVGKHRNSFAVPSSYEEGDLIAGLQFCLAIPEDELAQHPIIAHASGVEDLDPRAYTNPSGVHHGPIVVHS